MDHPIHKIRPIPFHTHLSTNQTQAKVALRQRPMPEVMTGGTGGGGGSLDCRSFWKAGANEGPSAPIREFHGSSPFLLLFFPLVLAKPRRC
jgi:hypothetical protein